MESVETQPGEDGKDSVKFAIRVNCDIPCRYNECVSFELIARWRVITALDEAFLYYRINN
ncbi:MAG: hypothetical protein QMD77_03015 [Patescibacteria group bacterium]|nr:hypothetical protein [Patescibacteria group bacterium]